MPLEKKIITLVTAGKPWEQWRMIYREDSGAAFGTVNYVLFTQRNDVIKEGVGL